jgi:hypothetical protein
LSYKTIPAGILKDPVRLMQEVIQENNPSGILEIVLK